MEDEIQHNQLKNELEDNHNETEPNLLKDDIIKISLPVGHDDLEKKSART